MKKLSIVLLSYITAINPVMAQTNDYSTGNTNPIVKYEYNPQSQWAQNTSVGQQRSKELTYFSPQINSPLQLASQSKYKHLAENSGNLTGCWDRAGAAYKVDPWLLMAVAKVESGFKSTAINVNKDKSKSMDLGMMQINTTWLPTLKKFGITPKDLFNSCTSVFVGAWIIAQNIRHFGYNQDGIGAYNSPRNVTIRRNYARKVYIAYNELVKDFHPQVYQKIARN